jgi:ElaB/YqjD/DUF883 family membrane-anchored ribosome-binding protein
VEASDQYGADELKNRTNELRAKFDTALLSHVSDSSHEAIHEFSESIAHVVDGLLRERPIATLALGVGLGFFVGAAFA